MKVKIMTLEDRISKIESLKKKYPELAKQYQWYIICSAVEFCKDKSVSPEDDDTCDEILNQIDLDLAEFI